MAEGRPIGPQLEHRGWVSHAAFSSDGRTLVTAAQDGTARVWDAETGLPRGEPLDHSAFRRHWLWHPMDDISRSPRRCHLTRKRPPSQRPPARSGTSPRAANSPSSSLIPPPRNRDDVPAARSRLDVPSGIRSVRQNPRGGVDWLLWQSCLALGSLDRTVRAPPVETGFAVTSLAPLTEADFLVALAGSHRVARIHRTAAGDSLQVGGKQPYPVFSMTVDGTGPARWTIVGLADHTARLLRLSGLDGSKSFGIEHGQASLWHPRMVFQIAFAPDGRTLFTSDGTARRWLRAPGQLLGPPVPEPGVAAVTRSWSSGDGRRILVSGRDGTYQLLDGPTGRPVGGPLPIPPPGDSGEIPPAIVFSPDGRRMAACWMHSTPDPQPGIPTVRKILDAELRDVGLGDGQAALSADLHRRKTVPALCQR